MSRIEATFAALAAQKRKALIPFVTAGDPDPAVTVPLMHALAAAGADVLELGVPFSDQMADGPTIQRSSERALHKGTSLRHVLGFVAEFRKTNDRTPVVLMGYANPIEAMGYPAFTAAAREAGVDGVLVVDYPPEESATLAKQLGDAGIDPIFLIAPTSTDARIEKIAALARGYVYYVSLRGVTGAATLDIADIRSKLAHLRAKVSVPIGGGFGIRDGKTARAVAEIANAVVIGSRLVEEIEKSPAGQVLDNVSILVKDIRAAIDHRDS
jgi:tryptophan synthase alpha chain